MKTTDVELSKAISSEVHEFYETALQFIQTNPDHSLVKFRHIAEAVVCKVAEKNDLKFKSDNLKERIDFLFKCQLISESLTSNLHIVRAFGNSGAHKTPRFEGEAEFYESRKSALVASAHDARNTVVSILVEIYSIINNDSTEISIELAPAGHQVYREILYDACVEESPKIKLKAGITCETILIEQNFHAPIVVSSNFAAHISNLKVTALGFYDASCTISANIDDYSRSHGYSQEPEDIICQKADVEALFKYANLALTDEPDTLLKEKGMRRLKASADRKYSPAEALYGLLLYDDEKYDYALQYLGAAAKKDEALSLRYLFYVHTDGKACPVNINKALEYLNRAIELGCPDSLATLGEAYHKGVLVAKDDEKARELLERSIEKGSAYGKNYYTVKFNDLPGKIANTMKEIGEALVRAVKDNKPEPIKAENKIGPNEPCHCGSGKKYKKCCKNMPNKLSDSENFFASLKSAR